MKRADVERFKFSNSLSYGMFYDRLLGIVRKNYEKRFNIKGFRRNVRDGART